MKLWMLFVLGAVICWGAYVPTIHHGQLAFTGKNRALWAFLFVGLAYFLVAVIVPVLLLLGAREASQLGNTHGWSISTLAGVFGALGALCVILALINGGSPLYVAPLVFAGAPLVNVLVSMILKRPTSAPSPMFFLGIALAAAGAGLVLRFKPS